MTTNTPKRVMLPGEPSPGQEEEAKKATVQIPHSLMVQIKCLAAHQGKWPSHLMAEWLWERLDQELSQ